MSDRVAVDLLRRLVRTDTVNPPGGEIAAARLLAEWVAGQPWSAQCAIDEYAPGRANLVVTKHFGRAGPTLMLNTHLDVVPIGSGWTRDPLGGDVADGALWGRGAADAKGALAAMAVAFGQVVRRSDDLAGSLVLTAVADEEDGSAGARRLVEQCAADAVLVGEPTQLRLMTAHKGSVRPVIEIRGLASHAAQPQHGRNAIVAAAAFVEALSSYAADLRPRAHPLVGAPTAVPVLIDGGEAPNTVAERVRITIDRRMVPGEDRDSVIAEFHGLIAAFTANHSGFAAEIVDLAPSTGGPSETPLSEAFVRACQKALLTQGLDPQPDGLVVNCDMTHFRAKGIPTVVCGPGRPEVMHSADEHLELHALHEAIELYTAIAREVLTGD